MASLVAQMVKYLPAMWETQVQSLGWEDPLEKEMETHSSTLAWKIHGQRSLVYYSPWGHRESDMTQSSFTFTFTTLKLLGFPGGSVVKNPPASARDSGLIPGSGRSPGEGNSNPLQYSYLKNPMDRGAWRAI